MLVLDINVDTTYDKVLKLFYEDDCLKISKAGSFLRICVHNLQRKENALFVYAIHSVPGFVCGIGTKRKYIYLTSSLSSRLASTKSVPLAPSSASAAINGKCKPAPPSGLLLSKHQKEAPSATAAAAASSSVLTSTPNDPNKAKANRFAFNSAGNATAGLRKKIQGSLHESFNSVATQDTENRLVAR